MAIPQSFSITLGNETYKVTIVWNTIGGLWILNLNDSSGNPVIQGIPLVTGLGLLRQYGYLGLDGDLFIQSTTDPYALPTFEGLGSTSNIYYTTDQSIL